MAISANVALRLDVLDIRDDTVEVVTALGVDDAHARDIGVSNFNTGEIFVRSLGREDDDVAQLVHTNVGGERDLGLVTAAVSKLTNCDFPLFSGPPNRTHRLRGKR